MRWFTPARLAAGGIFLLGAVALVLWLVPDSGTDILLVDPAHPVDPIVSVPDDGRTRQPGPIYFVDVREREARLLERFVPFLRPNGSSLTPAPPVSSAVEQQIGVQDMTESQKVAAVVALNHLGYNVKATTGGVTIVLVQPGAPAAEVLRTNDVIVAADGHEVSSVASLRSLLARHRPGDVVQIAFVRNGKRMTAAIKTVADPQDPKRAIVGVSARDNLKVKLPV